MSSILNLGCRQWNSGIKQVWGVTDGVASVLSQLELAKPGVLPNLRSGPTLVLASDYGGQHASAAHETFSFLLADLEYCRSWNEMRMSVRRRFLRDNRRMSYKGMNDRRKRSALLPFLDSANSIVGLLTTVLIEKEFASGLSFEGQECDSVPEAVCRWPAHVIRKFTWVTHFGAVLVAGLSNEGQNLLWFTDEDDIAANDSRIIDATPLVARILSAYQAHDMSHLRFGTTKCDNGNLFIEDFAAIPDLAAGALAELPKVGAVRTPLCGHIPLKALHVLSWLGVPSRGLCKVSLVVNRGDSADHVKVRALDLDTMH